MCVGVCVCACGGEGEQWREWCQNVYVGGGGSMYGVLWGVPGCMLYLIQLVTVTVTHPGKVSTVTHTPNTERLAHF